jgi:hypothetical protein
MTNYDKWQTRPLVREDAPYQPTRNRPTVMKIWSKAPEGCFIPRQSGRLIVGRNMTLTLNLVPRCNIRRTYIERPTPSFIEEQTPFRNTYISRREWKSWSRISMRQTRNDWAGEDQQQFNLPNELSIYLAIFAEDTCIYIKDCKEGYVLRGLQHGLNSIEPSCNLWNIKIN